MVLLFNKFSYSVLVDMMPATLGNILMHILWICFRVGELSILQAVSTHCCSLWLYV
jgi:hypothetical protein